MDLRPFDDFPVEAIAKSGDGEFAPFDPTVLSVKSVTLTVNVQKSGEEYFCQGTVEAEVRLECARCLTEYDGTQTQDLDFIIKGSSKLDVIEDPVADDEDYVYFVGSDLRVDVTEPVRQALILSLDLKPLCSEDCKGLCPSCGTNLNERTCGCKREQIDERWRGLLGLTDQQSDTK
ncbi:MAG: DUF177 domain-containing protein [candidate division Zixibacteria bacterium]|nr:DUF177 domain-containing protein [candidate division Zixibacteria bacterium]